MDEDNNSKILNDLKKIRKDIKVIQYSQTGLMILVLCLIISNFVSKLIR